MNWRLIFLLSLFGLAMALATISWIPDNIEPVFWLLIFIVCAYIIAKKCLGKYFLHGFLVSIVNSIWITAAHIFFYTAYIANHPKMASMNSELPLFLAKHPKLAMLIMGPLFGVAFGLVLGLFAFIASKIVKKNRKVIPVR